VNRSSGQFPNSVIHDTQSVKITRPESQVAFSKEKAVMHHDGSHVEVPGPARVAGKGKASDIVKVLDAVKQSYGRND
jgi:hypothetical protein